MKYTQMLSAICVSVLFVASAHAELVFDDQGESQAGQLQQRAQVREAAPSPVETALPAALPAQADIAVGDPSLTETPTLSRSELLRRKRMRQEIQNEDLLQARIEELRLRAEEERTKNITEGLGALSGETPAYQQQPLQEEMVGELNNAPQGAAVDSLVVTRAAPAAPVSEVVSSDSSSSSSSTSSFVLSPRFGVSSFGGDSSIYDIKSRFAAGLALGIEASGNLTFELGYTFAEYGMALLSSSPTVRFIENNNYWGYAGAARENVVMKQNTIDGMVKMNLLDPTAVFRPYLGAGAGYSKSFINYDDYILQNPQVQYVTGLGSDYELSQFIGSLSAGFDIRVSKAVSVGGLFKYTRAFTSREKAPLNNGAFFQNGWAGFPVNYWETQQSNFDKSVLAGTAARADFYSVQGGLSFRF